MRGKPGNSEPRVSKGGQTHEVSFQDAASFRHGHPGFHPRAGMNRPLGTEDARSRNLPANQKIPENSLKTVPFGSDTFNEESLSLTSAGASRGIGPGLFPPVAGRSRASARCC